MSSQKLPSGRRSIKVLENQVLVDGLAVRRQAHQLVLAAVDLEAAVVGDGGIQQPQRMRKLNLTRQLDAIAAADAEGRGAPFADAIQRQNRRLLERAREEGAGGVAFVMVGENDRRLDAVIAGSAGSLSRGRVFSFSQTGIAIAKLLKPCGANAR